jgi:hypothetical protein
MAPAFKRIGDFFSAKVSRLCAIKTPRDYSPRHQ